VGEAKETARRRNPYPGPSANRLKNGRNARTGSETAKKKKPGKTRGNEAATI